MPVKVNHLGSETWFKMVEGENSEFILKHNSGRSITIETPINLDKSFEKGDFEVHFLAKKNIKENDIFQVYCREKDFRIGWIIPTISLSSSLHDYADNEHFLKYAYIGIRESLKKIDSKIFTNCLPEDVNEVLYSDIFHEETVLLIVSRATYKDGYDFNIDRAIPSLIRNGYVSLSVRSPDEIQHEVNSSMNSRLYLEQVSKDIDSFSLIGGLLNHSFSYEVKSVFKFFFLYQIIELLIDSVYQNEQDKLIDELVGTKGDTGKTKEVLEKMQKFMSEKNRISLLVNQYAGIQGELNDLKYSCNILLQELGRDTSENFEGYFYKIRNFIFHQYRDFPNEGEVKLNDVINDFVNLMPSILCKFKLPQ
ncbi:hypothetical protein [Oceanimonas smirnovii]|uniref:hypothetical protein n=1 Tax=Oceanimonas smirnovii TaxID=264574 RepID=UPI0003A52A36|nr:hypothetical protein [Oceanimonas smirnovii]